jgi:starch synthase (maltosyl-transferring)
VRPGSEEYLHSEKYEIRPRDWHQAGNLNELVARVNQIRRDHAALQYNHTLVFHATDNPALLFYGKSDPGTASRSARLFVVVNTDPHHMQHGRLQMPIWELGIAPHQPYVVEDLLDGGRYTWYGEWNYVKLDPAERTAHILAIRS